MVQHTRADDLVEAASQVAYTLHRELVDLEILQLVFTLEFLGVADARGADVNAHDASLRLAQGMFGRLRCAASGDENCQVFPIGLTRPVQVEIYSAPAFILPALAVAVEVVDRRRIRVGVVKRLYLIRRLLLIV